MSKSRLFVRDLDSITESIFERIVTEVKLSIILRILKDIHDYDGRFDASHIFDLKDIVEHINATKISDVFICDAYDDILERLVNTKEFDMLLTNELESYVVKKK